MSLYYYNFQDINIEIEIKNNILTRLIIIEHMPEHKNEKNDLFDNISKQLTKYFQGKIKEFKINFKIEGTSFQKKVWLETCNITYGEKINYGELAKRINNPKASRAVGNALNKNKIQLIIPCHRVIGKNNLGGYGDSINLKRYLLNLEEKYK